MSNWSAFFAASAGAAATLAGLLFVAVSINLDRVLENRLLPLRALEGLVALMAVFFVAMIGLVPDQSAVAQGLEIAIVGTMAWSFEAWAILSTRVESRGFPRYWVRLLCCLGPTPPYVIGGLLIATGAEAAGRLWLAPAVLLSFAASLTIAWVLLIEIKR